MIKFISAVCPNCNANLELNYEYKITKCEYCGATIIIDDSTIKSNGNVSVDGIQTNRELIDNANKLLDMGEFIKAKRLFEEFSIKNPDRYQGWLGLIICRTRNFQIKDNNILFENDVKKYFRYFNRTAPQKIKEKYFETIDRYMSPEKYERLGQEEEVKIINDTKVRKRHEEKSNYEKSKKENEQTKQQQLTQKVNIGIYNLVFKLTKLINKIICWCLISFFAVVAFGCFVSKQYIIGIVSVCLSFLFSKKVKILIEKKSTLNANLIIIIRVVVIILWFILIIFIGNHS